MRLGIDSIIATVVLVVCLATSVAIYESLSHQEQAISSIISYIGDGEHRYALKGKQGCIGEMKTSLFFKEEQYVFRGSGTINLKIKDKQYHPSFTIQADFNSLGQLGGSVLSLQLEDTAIRIGTKGLNPVKTVLLMQQKDSATPQRFETLIPGPVTLRKNRKDGYRLEYLHFGKMLSNYSGLLSSPILQNISIGVDELSSTEETCKGALLQDLDVTPILTLLPFGVGRDV